MTRNQVSNFLLATPAEIAAELGARLKSARLAQGIRQGDLARMAGVSRAAVTSLENRGGSTLETFLRVAAALGLTREMQALFAAQPVSIAQLEAASKRIQRAPRKPHNKDTPDAQASFATGLPARKS